MVNKMPRGRTQSSRGERKSPGAIMNDSRKPGQLVSLWLACSLTHISTEKHRMNISLKLFWLLARKPSHGNGCKQTLEQKTTGLHFSLN